ncbi:short chain dehydrogenase [Pseudovibrio sp. Ad26]|uniref:short chain dehydrogenase n=1 Tax=Pseudovibrio sp. Ad26 TaxID=989410 RepID=UPI0007AE588E|nr:short chain dehydrogenase [Pseudovibrio sp. Ad26]KZK98981.1 short chain dehydrogenase [Pseudovibrio sp. Ad26]
MKILIIGASGMIGRAVSDALKNQHEVITASRTTGDIKVDMSNPASLRELFAQVETLDAIICAAGNGAMAPVATMSDDDLNRTLDSQLNGQMNVLRLGRTVVKTGGSITLTSGVASQETIPATSVISAACAGIEAFVRVAASEESSLRLNVVSPIFVKESMELFGMPTDGGLSAKDTAKAYLAALAGDMHGQTLATPTYAEMESFL